MQTQITENEIYIFLWSLWYFLPLYLCKPMKLWFLTWICFESYFLGVLSISLIVLYSYVFCRQLVVGPYLSFFKVYLFILESNCMWAGRGAERRGRGRISSRLHVEHRAQWGLDPMTHEIMTWAKIISWTLTWLSHPGIPVLICLN